MGCSVRGVHRSPALEKHRATLIRLGATMDRLAQSLEVVGQEASGTSTRSKGKKKDAAVVDEPEETVVYDPPVSHLDPFVKLKSLIR
jgi:hypothetical protein